MAPPSLHPAGAKTSSITWIFFFFFNLLTLLYNISKVAKLFIFAGGPLKDDINCFKMALTRPL